MVEKMKLLISIFFILLGNHLMNCSSHQKSLHMPGLAFRTIPTELIGQTLDAHPDIRELYMADNAIDKISLTDFPKQAAQLTYLSLQGNRITHIDEGSFKHMVNLTEVDLGMNSLKVIPDVKAPNLKKLNLSYNIITKIEEKTLKNFKKLEKLVLSGNPLISIHENGLTGPESLKLLYLERTHITSLPSKGISHLTGLNVRHTPSLLNMPSADKFIKLTEANLTYGMHSCAFIAFNEKRRKMKINKRHINQSASENNNDVNDTTISLVITKDVDDPGSINCIPEPTVFTPCDNILGSDVLRAFAWVISVVGVVGNLLKLVVVSHNIKKLSASKLLIYNLGFANFLMGIYLFGLCCIDAETYGDYFSHVPRWQFDGGCQAFGFLAVFSINLSMCCLTLLAVERYLLLHYKSQIGDEVKMSHVVYCLVVAWIYSFALAILPTAGLVSSYVDNAVCLPLDVSDPSSKAYVTWLLLSFTITFVVIMYCYTEVLRKNDDDDEVDSHTHVINIRIAKRMLIVTCSSFSCWTPISIIGLSVLYSTFNFNIFILKFLMVLFFPMHSVLTPALYAFVNKSFRNDAWEFVRSCGFNKSDNENKHNKHHKKTKKSSTNGEKSNPNKHDNFHLDMPNDSNVFRKHPVSIIEEHPECDDPNAPLTIKISSSVSKENIAKEDSYSYSPRMMDENDIKRYRSASSNVDNKRYSDPRYRSDTTATCSTGVSATSDVELLDM